MKKNIKNTKKNERMSIKEFKAWFSGILELRDDNWTPDAKQWKTIIDRINNLIDDVENTQPSPPQYNNIVNQQKSSELVNPIPNMVPVPIATSSFSSFIDNSIEDKVVLQYDNLGRPRIENVSVVSDNFNIAQ